MLIFTVFFEHQPNLPPKSALDKNDNFPQCAKQNWVFQKWSSLKNQNIYVDQNTQPEKKKNETNKNKKGFERQKQNRKPPKAEIIDEMRFFIGYI